MSPRCHRSRLVHTSSSNSSTTTPNHVALWLGLTSGLFSITSTVALAQSVNPPTAEVTTLEAIKVHRTTDAEPPPYAGGQVATGGRVGLFGNKDVMDTPFSVISYTDRYIEDKQAQDLSSVIAATDPTVFSNGATGMIMDSFSLRGFSLSNSDIALGGLYGMVPYWRISPEFVERIDVQKGPAAMLNGMPPKPNTLLAPDWTFANTKDKAAVLHAEFDISDNVMAYANYGRSKTDFDALASSTYTVFTH